MQLKVIYHKDRCIGNGNCIKNDSTNFSMNDNEGRAILNSSSEEKENHFELEKEVTESEKQAIIDAAKSCPVNAIEVIDGAGEVLVAGNVEEEHIEEIIAEYDDLVEFQMDPKGYFLIRINKEKEQLEIGFCNMKNILKYKVVGKTPIEIYMTVLKKGIIDRPDHAAYLGRELQKAYDALKLGKEYVQDDDLFA